MIKKYSLLTILTVIILVGFSAEHFLAQIVMKGKKGGKRGVKVITVENPPKQQKKKKGTLQALELEPEPDQSSRWELTGEIKVTGTETYPHYNGSCTKTIDRTYKSKVILDYMQEGFPSMTDPNEVAKIAANLPTMSVGRAELIGGYPPLICVLHLVAKTCI